MDSRTLTFIQLHLCTVGQVSPIQEIHLPTPNLTNPEFIECELTMPLVGQKINTTFDNGSLGSPIDEERSEMR